VIEFDRATEVLFASRRQLGFGDSLGAEIDLDLRDWIVKP